MPSKYKKLHIMKEKSLVGFVDMVGFVGRYQDCKFRLDELKENG